MFIGMLRPTGQQMTTGLQTAARVSLRTAETFFTKPQREYIYIYIYIYIFTTTQIAIIYIYIYIYSLQKDCNRCNMSIIKGKSAPLEAPGAQSVPGS